MANGEGKKREGTECGLHIVFLRHGNRCIEPSTEISRLQSLTPRFPEKLLQRYSSSPLCCFYNSLSSPNHNPTRRERNNKTALISAAGHSHSLMGNAFFKCTDIIVAKPQRPTFVIFIHNTFARFVCLLSSTVLAADIVNEVSQLFQQLL